MAESLGQATVDLIANTGGFEAGMDRAARKMQSVSKEAAYQGNQLEKLVGQIDPVTGALTRLDNQQQKLDAHFKAGRLPIEDYQKFTGILNAQKAATDATVTGFGKLDRQMASNGQTLKQYQNNLRNVPAQFTDIFTSLQGGQAPLTVLIQQGGQLKDMFGGVGSAAKALGGYIVGLANPLTVGAAAAGALGAVFYDAEKQVSAFNKSLFSGTASSGQTAASLAAISKTVSSITGDISEANAAVITLAGSSKLSQAQFVNLAQASASISEFTGKSAAEVAKSLGDIGESATKAAEKISSQYGLLTSAQYDVISALDEQGKKQEALDALSGFLNENAQKRLAAYKASLSDIERDWNNIGTAISNAYSRVKAELFPDLTKQAEIIERILKTREDGGVTGAISTGLSKLNTALGLAEGNDDDSTEALKTRLSLIRERLTVSQQTALVDGEAGKAYQIRIAAESKWNSEHKSSLAGLAKLEDEISEKRKLGLAAGKSQVEIDKEVAALREKYEKSLPKPKAYTEDAGTKELDQAKQVYAALQAQSLAIGTQEGSTRKIGAAAQELAKWEQQIADIKTKGTLTAAQKSLLADESAITAQKQQNAALEAQNVQREKAAASAQKLLSLEQQLNDELQNVQSGFDQQMAGVGLGDEARKRLQDDLKIREDYQKKLEQLNRDYRKIQNPTAEDTAAYEAQNAVIKSALERRLDIQKNYYAAEDEAQASWSNGALQALNTYMESANDIAAQSRTLVANSLSQLEDAFVKLATDGKLSFKSLADSIIADLARIAAKTLIVQPLLASLTSGGGGVLSGVLGSSGAGGSSGSGQLLGVLDAAGKSISLATSGFGQAVQAGYTGGEGFIGGIQGAFSSGAGYINDSITSAFATGSSTAASVIAQSAATNTGYQIGGTLVSGEIGSATYATSAASSGISSANVVTAAISGFIQGYKANGVKGGVAAAGGAVGGMYAGAQAGSYFGPIGTAVGAVIGTIVGAAFGSSIFAGEWQTKDQGIQLGVQGGMLQSANYEFQKKKGGLFHSNKKRTNLTALDPGLQKALDDSYNGTLGTVLGLFDALNVELNDGVLDGLNIATKQISTKGKTSDQIQTELTAWFTDLGNAAIGAVDSAFGGLGLAGRTVESLTAFVNGLFSVNNVLANLNVGIFDVSVSGAFAAEQLAKMAGGLDKFTEASAAYYDKFFTDGEKASDVLKAVGVQFAAVGVGLPASRQGFRDLVEAIDITTESGRNMYSVLIGLSGNAAAAYDILEQRASAGASSAMAAVQRAIDAQKTSINDMLQTAQGNVSDLTSVSNDLSSALKALRGDSDSAIKMLRAQAVATLQSALTTARAGGSLVDFPGLKDALDTVGSNSTDVYSTLEDFNRDQAQTAYAIDLLNKLNGKQLSSAEQTVKTLQDQLDRLDAQLAFSQSLLDGVNGVDNSILSVADAIRLMNASILTSLATMGAKTPGGVSSSIDLLYGAILDRKADEAGKNYWLGEIAKGNLRPDQLEEAIRNAAKSNGTLPAFARGTNSWDGGPALMGEFGPELVLPNGGATVYNAQDTARMLNKSGSSDPQAASDMRDQARKNDQRWSQLLRYTQYLEQGYINGFPTVAEGSQ